MKLTAPDVMTASVPARHPAVAYLVLVRSMALAFAMLVGFGAPVCAGLFGGYTASGKIGEKSYEFTISQADIRRTPIWSPDADFPPLSARKAQEIARRQMQELLGGGKEPWVLRETTIADMGDGMHFVYAMLLSGSFVPVAEHRTGLTKRFSQPMAVAMSNFIL